MFFPGNAPGPDFTAGAEPAFESRRLRIKQYQAVAPENISHQEAGEFPAAPFAPFAQGRGELFNSRGIQPGAVHGLDLTDGKPGTAAKKFLQILFHQFGGWSFQCFIISDQDFPAEFFQIHLGPAGQAGGLLPVGFGRRGRGQQQGVSHHRPQQQFRLCQRRPFAMFQKLAGNDRGGAAHGAAVHPNGGGRLQRPHPMMIHNFDNVHVSDALRSLMLLEMVHEHNSGARKTEDFRAGKHTKQGAIRVQDGQGVLGLPQGRLGLHQRLVRGQLGNTFRLHQPFHRDGHGQLGNQGHQGALIMQDAKAGAFLQDLFPSGAFFRGAGDDDGGAGIPAAQQEVWLIANQGQGARGKTGGIEDDLAIGLGFGLLPAGEAQIAFQIGHGKQDAEEVFRIGMIKVAGHRHVVAENAEQAPVGIQHGQHADAMAQNELEGVAQGGMGMNAENIPQGRIPHQAMQMADLARQRHPSFGEEPFGLCRWFRQHHAFVKLFPARQRIQ